MENTLLLSASYEPLGILPWQKAITLYFLEKVDVLECYDVVLHSPTLTMNLPAVVKLNHFVRPFPRRIKFSRQNLYYRDNYTCQYCRKNLPTSQLTYDHVIPRSKGGKTSWTNVVTACVRCNLKKGNKLLHQINFKLEKEPSEPNWLPVFSSAMRPDSAPSLWRNYLGTMLGSAD